MANDYVERLQAVLDAFMGCSTSDGQIIDLDEFNEALEELAYIVNKMEFHFLAERTSPAFYWV